MRATGKQPFEVRFSTSKNIGGNKTVHGIHEQIVATFDLTNEFTKTKYSDGGLTMSTQKHAAPIKEEARQRFEREKQAYWAMREELLKQYLGQWVAVVNGQVVAVGNKMGKVMEEAFRKTKSKVMFVSEVGHEDRVLRIRQTAADTIRDVEIFWGNATIHEQIEL